MRGLVIAVMVAVSVACGLACGGDDDGGAVSTGLPASTRLSELDAQQVMDACGEIVVSLDAALTSELERFNCTLRAVPMSISVTLSGQTMGDAAKCRELRDRCLAGEDIGGNVQPVTVQPVGSQINCTSPAAVAASQSCEATVGEYESCLDAIVANAQTSFRRLDCSLVADPSQLQNAMQPPPPPQPQVCADLDARCPQLGIGGIGAAAAP